jgi:16S rRNA (adenine1518-N6/adenine1519-N6)-dimethyltransferase
MVQREVAHRMVAKPGGKDYGLLSLAVQYYTIPEVIRIVPAAVFYPRPDVDSAIVRLLVRQAATGRGGR